jgi:hypothetical protein
MTSTKTMAINRIKVLLASKQNNYIILVKTSDLIEAGHAHLTLGNSTYTYVNKSWLNPSLKLKVKNDNGTSIFYY